MSNFITAVFSWIVFAILFLIAVGTGVVMYLAQQVPYYSELANREIMTTGRFDNKTITRLEKQTGNRVTYTRVKADGSAYGDNSDTAVAPYGTRIDYVMDVHSFGVGKTTRIGDYSAGQFHSVTEINNDDSSTQVAENDGDTSTTKKEPVFDVTLNNVITKTENSGLTTEEAQAVSMATLADDIKSGKNGNSVKIIDSNGVDQSKNVKISYTFTGNEYLFTRLGNQSLVWNDANKQKIIDLYPKSDENTPYAWTGDTSVQSGMDYILSIMAPRDNHFQIGRTYQPSDLSFGGDTWYRNENDYANNEVSDFVYSTSGTNQPDTLSMNFDVTFTYEDPNSGTVSVTKKFSDIFTRDDY